LKVFYTMPAQTHIPVNKLKVTAVGGVDIMRLDSKGKHPRSLKDHRDEYYVLAVVIKGSGQMKCDMGTISFIPTSIIVIKPYQIHSAELTDDYADGYFISIAPFLLPAFCKDILDSLTVSDQCTSLTSVEMKELLHTVDLLHNTFHADNIYKVQITINLLNALLYYVCSFYPSAQQKHDQKQNQSLTLTQNFKSLVLEHSFLHNPSFYAEKLHIAASHLNDCVKATIGLSVTQFLQQSMLLEAKRQLYYTNDNVKTIALTLGFEDHAYFSRLFKTLTNETPLKFRLRYRN
jgi:AraC family transcriptional activator of pobA